MNDRGISSVLLICLLGMISVVSHFESTQTSFDFSTAHSASQSQKTESQASALLQNKKMNLNLCTQAELELVPSIGPTLAKRILDYKKNHGPFESIKELANIKGIGEQTVLKTEAYLFAR